MNMLIIACTSSWKIKNWASNFDEFLMASQIMYNLRNHSKTFSKPTDPKSSGAILGFGEISPSLAPGTLRSQNVPILKGLDFDAVDWFHSAAFKETIIFSSKLSLVIWKMKSASVQNRPRPQTQNQCVKAWRSQWCDPDCVCTRGGAKDFEFVWDKAVRTPKKQNGQHSRHNNFLMRQHAAGRMARAHGATTCAQHHHMQ